MTIYLITTGFSLICYATVIVAMVKRIKRDGYIIIERKKSFAEKLFVSIRYLIMAGIPILNVLIACLILYGFEDLYERIIESSLADGDIYKPPEVGATVTNGIKEVPYETVEKTIRYDRMTTAEKIQYLNDEKARLLATAEPGVKQGKVRKKNNQKDN